MKWIKLTPMGIQFRVKSGSRTKSRPSGSPLYSIITSDTKRYAVIWYLACHSFRQTKMCPYTSPIHDRTMSPECWLRLRGVERTLPHPCKGFDHHQKFSTESSVAGKRAGKNFPISTFLQT